MLSNPIMKLLDKEKKRSKIPINVGIPTTTSTPILIPIVILTIII